MKLVKILVIVIAILIFVSICLQVYLINKNSKKAEIWRDDLKVENLSLTKDKTSYGYISVPFSTISGKIKNTTKKDFQQVTVYITLEDKDNNVVYTTKAYIDNLDVGKTWKFSIEISSYLPKFDNYYISGISAIEKEKYLQQGVE